MKQRSVLLALAFLTSVIVVPMGYSSAQMDNMANSTNTNDNMTMTSSVNATLVTQSSVNTTQSNIGQQVSDFVHQAVADFQKQRSDLITVIKQCHENLKNSASGNTTQVRADCQTQMKTIDAKYKEERDQFHQLFLQFRENITALRHDVKGMHHLSDNEKSDVLKQINGNATKNGIRTLDEAFGHMSQMGSQHGQSEVAHGMQVRNQTGSDYMSPGNNNTGNAKGMPSMGQEHGKK